jgi:hypothetical protein
MRAPLARENSTVLRHLIVMAAVLAAPTPTLALDLPARTPGLWEPHK